MCVCVNECMCVVCVVCVFCKVDYDTSSLVHIHTYKEREREEGGGMES